VFEDSKGVITIRKLKENRQHNDQKDKQRSTKHTHKTKVRVTLKTGGELRCSGMLSSSCSTSDTRGFNLVTNPRIPETLRAHWIRYLHDTSALLIGYVFSYEKQIPPTNYIEHRPFLAGYHCAPSRGHFIFISRL